VDTENRVQRQCSKSLVLRSGQKQRRGVNRPMPFVFGLFILRLSTANPLPVSS